LHTILSLLGYNVPSGWVIRSMAVKLRIRLEYLFRERVINRPLHCICVAGAGKIIVPTLNLVSSVRPLT
jgi:hypothetical protein